LVAHTVRLEWIRENTYQLWDRDNFPILMTHAPDGVNGADLLPLSLIGCSAWDIIDILKEQDIKVAGLEVVAESQQDDDPPWQFRRILVHYRFHGRGLDMASLRQAIQLSESKFCSIFNTLRSAVEITTEVEIIEDERGI
jgi:putative redox protein